MSSYGTSVSIKGLTLTLVLRAYTTPNTVFIKLASKYMERFFLERVSSRWRAISQRLRLQATSLLANTVILMTVTQLYIYLTNHANRSQYSNRRSIYDPLSH